MKTLLRFASLCTFSLLALQATAQNSDQHQNSDIDPFSDDFIVEYCSNNQVECSYTSIEEASKLESSRIIKIRESVISVQKPSADSNEPYIITVGSEVSSGKIVVFEDAWSHIINSEAIKPNATIEAEVLVSDFNGTRQMAIKDAKEMIITSGEVAQIKDVQNQITEQSKSTQVSDSVSSQTLDES